MAVWWGERSACFRLCGEVRMAGATESRVVIVGGGFGGLNAASELIAAGHEVTIIDRHAYDRHCPTSGDGHRTRRRDTRCAVQYQHRRFLSSCFHLASMLRTSRSYHCSLGYPHRLPSCQPTGAPAPRELPSIYTSPGAEVRDIIFTMKNSTTAGGGRRGDQKRDRGAKPRVKTRIQAAYRC